MTPTGNMHKVFKRILQCTGVVWCLVPFAHPTAAQNLVPNPGFEVADTCSTMGFGVEGPLFWHSANVTPDHLQGCLPYGNALGLPLNFITFQEPFEGSSCAGMHTYHQNGSTENREWIQAPLLEPLVVGQTYYCSFRANAAFGGNAQYPQIWLASDKVGMLFTMQDRPWAWGDPYPVPPNHAHIAYPQILADTVGWTLVSGSFVADSAYRYIVLGNFFDDAHTDTVHLNAQPSWGAYYLYDAICVSPTQGECPMATGLPESIDGSILVNITGGGQWLQLDGAATGSKTWVYDAGGRLMAQFAFSGSSTQPIGNWPPGVYVLQVQGGDGTVWHKKFVVMR